jgi:DNA-binding response OmpR family regulator
MPAKIVVILEDDPGARDALSLLLSDWDYEPVAAADARGAKAALGGNMSRVAAIITDYNLGGGVDGISETGQLIAAGAAVPVLVISGTMQGRAGVKARDAGFHFLTKPVTPVDIKAWLDARLG